MNRRKNLNDHPLAKIHRTRCRHPPIRHPPAISRGLPLIGFPKLETFFAVADREQYPFVLCWCWAVGLYLPGEGEEKTIPLFPVLITTPMRTRNFK